jgi:NAD-dependent dihydropyrimidine dehydrogenase PreA subunit
MAGQYEIYVIGPPCIGTTDKSCVEVCPVDCIHETDNMLVIDPDTCIGCSVCEAECPVEAIAAETAIPRDWEPFRGINRAITEGRDRVNQLVVAYLEDIAR